jgi:pSer/pThr/pTyr-binding forkhead associated (FHA) protein
MSPAMARLVVDVLFRGKVLETIPFDAPALRIGRLPENDIVLDNLGVSRFHASLLLEEGRVYLEDAGSENGARVNGQRIAARREVAAGDRIAIGKHELVVRRSAEGDPVQRPARRKSDAWDGNRTYVLGAAPPDLASPVGQPRPRRATAASREATDVGGKQAGAASAQRGQAERSSSGREADRSSSERESVPMTPKTPKSAATEPISDTVELDYDFDGSLSDDSESPLTVRLTDSNPPAQPPMHAGFIVQRDGKLERVVPWTAELLVAGRSSECDILLGQDEVSRRHARFERSGDVFEVCDLGSVNGTFVNGRRVERQPLRVGDVVQIEGFQLTFVLDREPIDAALAAKPAAPGKREDTFAMTMLQEAMPHRPGFTQVGGAASEQAEALPEVELLGPDDDENDATLLGGELEKAEPVVPLRGSSRATSVQDLGRISSPNLGRERALRLELHVRLDLLPPALRQALEDAGASELVLPAELKLRI